MTLELSEPICALASPYGSAERGIIRISGAAAATAVLDRFKPDLPERWRTAKLPRRHAGTFRLNDSGLSVPVAAQYWPTARSYTGEPMIELHLTGSPPVLDRILSLLHRGGIRPARPGEFTLRAFLNGKIDLVQAEAVLGVIDADELGELQLALQQLAGGLSSHLGDLRRDLLELLADLEAGLDFVDEDIEFVTREELSRRLQVAREKIEAVAAHQAGRGTREQGYRVVLAGLPNAGKSTLLNALAERDVALVSAIPGTTRDYLTISVSWNNLPLELVDTAGWEISHEAAMSRAQQLRLEQVRQADLVLWCSAGDLPTEQQELDERQKELCRADSRSFLALKTKRDVAGKGEQPTDVLSLSAVSGAGLRELRSAVVDCLSSSGRSDRLMIGSTSARCSGALDQVRDALQQAVESLEQEFGDEILALEIRRALDGLGQILGLIYTDDILDRIFSKFCIGK